MKYDNLKIGEIEDGNFYTEPKKFVFKIDPENIDFIESLSYEEKQIIINELLYNYRESINKSASKKSFFKENKKHLSIILFILIIIPVFYFAFTLAWNATQATNSYMQQNFEKLYNN